MLRKDLIEKLDLIKPALSDDNFVPIFQNYCFDNNVVYGYKDDLGILARCEIPDSFSVHGKTLLELLKSSNAKEVDFDIVDEEVIVKSGRSKIKLPFMTKADFLFDEPEDEEWDFMFEIDDVFLDGLELCLTTASSDTTQAAFMGVAIKGGADTFLYSCDGDALSRYRLEGKNTKDAQYTMPRDFCEVLIRVAEKTKGKLGHIYVNQDWAIAELINDYRVFGRIIQIDDPMDFEKEINRVIKKDPSFVEIPVGLGQALTRARVLADPESKSTSFTVEKGKLKLFTKTHMGEIKDTLTLKNHADVEANVSAKLIFKSVMANNEFSILDDLTVYRKGDEFFQVVSNYESR